jgi:protein-tyrosine phosphatase
MKTFEEAAYKVFNVLFVCTGNTCRSPMAAGILEHLLPEEMRERVEVYSAGISAGDGYSASDGAARVSRKRGIDLSGHSSRRLTRELIERSDLVLGMQDLHLEEVRRLCPARVEYALLLTELGGNSTDRTDGIADPFGGSDEVYEQCFVQIEENVETGMEFLIELVNDKEDSS